MKHNFRFVFIVAMLFGASFNLFAQRNWGEDGEIEAAEIIIEKDRLIELPQANRSFEKISPPPVYSSNADLKYDFKTFNYSVKDFDPRIRILTLKDEVRENPGSNYIKGGLGNYYTPYFESFIGSRKSKTHIAGLHMRHLSSATGPVDGRNSGSSDNHIQAYSKLFTDKAIFNLEANYDRTMRHFYAYQPGTEINRDDIRQIYNSAGMSAGLQSNNADKFTYHFNLGLNHISDRFDAAENTFQGNGGFEFKADELLNLGLTSNAYISGYVPGGGDPVNRNLVRVSPYGLFQLQGLKVKMGLNAVVDYDGQPANNGEAPGGKFHIYPLVNADLKIADGFGLYAGVDGDMQFNSLQTFVNENPFIAPGSTLLNTSKLYNAFAGFRGRISNAVSFEGGFNYGKFRNMHFYVNGEADSTRMDIIYDPYKTSLFNLYAELGISRSEAFRSSLRADYFNYNTTSFENAWHRPDYKVSMINSFNLSNKIIFSSDLYWIGGLRGFNRASGTSTELRDIIDLNLKVDYRLSQKLSSFVSFNNILSQKYERYWNYPSRGLIIMAGLTYSF